MSRTTLVSQAVGSAIEAAAAWLLDIAERAHAADELRPEGYLGVLLGLQVATNAGVDEAVEPLARWSLRTAARLEADGPGGTFDPFEHDPRLVLLDALTMTAHDVPCGVVSRFAAEVRAALDGPEPVHPAFGAEHALLTALGRAPTAPMRPLRLADLPVAPFDLLVAESARRRVTDLVAGATRLGQCPPPRSVRAALRDVLGALTLQAFKDYDLVRGCELLRTLRYLRVHHRGEEAGYAVSYLLSQQRADGRFGYLSEELAGRPVESPDLQVYLPLTVSAIWALAETSVSGFSLLPTDELALRR